MRYGRLRFDFDDAERKRVVGHLIKLRTQLDEEIPAKDADDNLLLATWNIRDLGKVNRRGFGNRQPETYYYIAEVLSRFDFVAVQEVNELDEWEKIVDLLGPDYGWIATDVSDPAAGGNEERLTYLYDKRRVWFQNIAGEIVLPAKLLITSNVEAKPNDAAELTVDIDGTQVGKQFRRTPFAALFQSAWFKFEICTVHIYYGADSGPQLNERIQEIERIAQYFAKRADRSLKDGRSSILLGDFNIIGEGHKTMKALLDSGFQVPGPLRQPTNIDRTMFYDQIAFKTRPGDLEYLAGPKRAGAFEIFKNLYTPQQFDEFKAAALATPNGKKADKKGKLAEYYEDWRTYQFSDHLPLWVRLKVNASEDYLKTLLA